MKKTSTDRRALALLALGHTFSDVSQGAVPALLPFLVVERGLSYSAASGLIVAATGISALIQPFLGFYSDRRPLPWLMPVGLLAGGLGIALSGVAPTYWLIAASILLSGAGVAAFHPEGSRFANYVSGQAAQGMSVYTSSGTLGFVLGPVLVTALVYAFGLRGTLLLAVPASVVAVALVLDLPRIAAYRPSASSSASEGSEYPSAWGAFARLTAVIALRTAVYFGMMSFVPLYYVKVRGASIAEANAALTIMLLAGAIGGMICGWVADRFGLKRVLVSTLIAIAPLILVFMAVSGIVGLLVLGFVGLATIGSSSIAVLMGQGYVRSHIGVASGITLGSAIGVGGLAVPLLGYLADHYGLNMAMYSMIVFPILAVGIAQTLPTGAKL